MNLKNTASRFLRSSQFVWNALWNSDFVSERFCSANKNLQQTLRKYYDPAPPLQGLIVLQSFVAISVLVNFKTAYFFCFFTDPFILLLIFLQNTQTLDEFLKDRGGQQTFRPGFGETVDEVDEITIPKG